MDERKCHEFVDTRSNLEARLDTNTRYGDNILKTWLPPHLEVAEGEKVLDIGCGDGTQLRLVAEVVARDHHCTGIDRDPEMIRTATAKSAEFRPSVSFREMDMDTIGDPDSPFADASFDLIYSVYAFYYSRHGFKTLDALRRKLRPSGRISIVGPYKDNNRAWFEFLAHFMEMPASIMVSTTTFMERILDYARKNAAEVQTHEFVNRITLPSCKALRDYWAANIYYEPSLNVGFERCARRHFEHHDTFVYFKKAQMITMKTAP